MAMSKSAKMLKDRMKNKSKKDEKPEAEETDAKGGEELTE